MQWYTMRFFWRGRCENLRYLEKHYFFSSELWARQIPGRDPRKPLWALWLAVTSKSRNSFLRKPPQALKKVSRLPRHWTAREKGEAGLRLSPSLKKYRGISTFLKFKNYKIFHNLNLFDRWTFSYQKSVFFWLHQELRHFVRLSRLRSKKGGWKSQLIGG